MPLAEYYELVRLAGMVEREERYDQQARDLVEAARSARARRSA